MKKKTLIFIFITICTSFFLQHTVYSEGTKKTSNDSLSCSMLFVTKSASIYYDVCGTYLADSNHAIHVAIKNRGENLYMGFNYFALLGDSVKCRIKHNGIVVWGEKTIPNPPSGLPGAIGTWFQAINGPNVINPGGYNPFIFRPSEPGDYIVEFDFQASIGYKELNFYDFTVVDTTVLPLQATDGRVWSKNWVFQSCTSDSIALMGLVSTFFVQTNDSIVDSVNIFHAGIWLPTQINFNRNGCFPPPASFELSRRSRLDNYRYPEFKTFFNEPDSTVFPSGTIGEILPGTASMTPNCLGQYNIIINSSKTGPVEVHIEVNPSPGLQPEDVVISDTVRKGIDTVVWNGFNGLGVRVPFSARLDVIIIFMNGLMNLPLYYVPANWYGFRVGLKRPISFQPLQFWNDTLLPTGQIQRNGCLSTQSTGCHDWPGTQYPVQGFGSNRTINTWWYSANPDTLFQVSLAVQASTPDSIQGIDSVCFTPSQNYSYTIFPQPLPGAQSFEWNLYNGAVLLQTWNTTVPTLNIVTFPGTGTYLLIARGLNTCMNGLPDTIIIHVFPGVPVGITITGSENDICAGEQVTFSAHTTNGGTSPHFDWKVNGLPAGPDDSVFTYTPLNHDTVRCILTSSNTVCVSNNPATSDSIVMIVVTRLAVSLTVSSTGDTVCAGDTVTFTTTPHNGGTNPAYQWKVNGINAGNGQPTYSYVPLNGDSVRCILTSSETCTSGNPASGIRHLVSVNQILPVNITITPSSNPFCPGSQVTFTTNPTHGGTTPAYQWKVNGNNVGSGQSTYSYFPSNGDSVRCILTSSEQCTSNNPVSSIQHLMIENLNFPSGVSINAVPNPFCEGTQVIVTATPFNGGLNPSYVWKLNGNTTGTNSQTLILFPHNNDSVRCIMTSNLYCVSGNPVSSSKLFLNTLPAPDVSFKPCFDTITTINAKPIRLKGGIPPGGTYTGPGVSNGYFYPAVAGTGNKAITYSYTNSALCTDAGSLMLDVRPVTAFICGGNLTDIRDNKVYTTIQIGSQCWFSIDLNYGTEIPASQYQRDNCIPEKYTSHLSLVTCHSYQWDELMTYDDTPNQQGLCPPGWHVPTEADWNALFANWTNNGFAGAPLKYDGYSGFNALLSGSQFFNKTWNFNGFAAFFWSSTSHGPIEGLEPCNERSRSECGGISCLQDEFLQCKMSPGLRVCFEYSNTDQRLPTGR